MRRTLPTNHDVIVEFLNQSLPEARNQRYSLWFKDNKLYSYRYNLATIMPDNVLFINANLIKYSTTTSAHMGDLRQTAEDLQTFIIPLDLQSNEVLNWYWEQVEALIFKYLRARATKDYHKGRIITTMNVIEQYVDYMNLDRAGSEYLHKHEIVKQLFKYKIL